MSCFGLLIVIITLFIIPLVSVWNILMNCPSCKAQISEKDLVCPHCKKVLQLKCKTCGHVTKNTVCEIKNFVCIFPPNFRKILTNYARGVII